MLIDFESIDDLECHLKVCPNVSSTTLVKLQSRFDGPLVDYGYCSHVAGGGKGCRVST